MHPRRNFPGITLKVLSVTLPMLFAGHLLTTPAAAEECSFTKTNRNCEITLDRNSFVFPAPLQMYPKAVVTVRIIHGNEFELYTLDPAPGQASTLPDVTSAAVGNLNTIFAAAATLSAATVTPTPPAAPPTQAAEANLAEQNNMHAYGLILKSGCLTDSTSPNCKKLRKADPCKADPNGIECRQEKNAELADAIAQALNAQKEPERKAAKEKLDQFNAYRQKCDPSHVSQFSDEGCMLGLLRFASERIVDATYQSKAFYTELNTLLTPDAQPPLASIPISNASKPHVAFEHLLDELCGLHSSPPSYYLPCGVNHPESLIHKQAEASAFVAALLTRMTKPPSDIAVPTDLPNDQLPKPPSQTVLNAMQLVSQEQAALDAIRKDLEGYAFRLQDLAEHPRQMEYTVGYIQDSQIDRRVTRTVNYTLNRLNLVSNSQEAANDGSKKVPIVTVSVVYGEARWEASTGIAVVFRPIRTFTVAPPIAPAIGTLPTNEYISLSKAGPEFAPFVAGDLRLGPDHQGPSGWRTAFYATAGIGYNTSQESADYLVGPSISWRNFLLSGLCDFGHGVRLAPGYTNGAALAPGTTATTPPTENYWVPAVAIGFSVRIPGITGR
jgi:hypothetical protein